MTPVIKIGVYHEVMYSTIARWSTLQMIHFAMRSEALSLYAQTDLYAFYLDKREGPEK
jgi:hypothetical protein